MATPPERTAPDGKHIDGSAPSAEEKQPAAVPRYAYVLLVMKGDAYVPGALVAAYSLRLTSTPHDIVCMVTPDVTEEARSRLRVVFDRVVEVPYISATCVPLKTAKQRDMYATWKEVAFTKWNALSLTDYAKVLFVDADKIVLSNVDELFSLRAPAGTFSNPWSETYVDRRALPDYYGKLKHGERVSGRAIEKGLTEGGFVLIGTMVLLEPSASAMEAYRTLMGSTSQDKPFGFPNCHSMLDEQSIVSFLHKERGQEWTFIHQIYNLITWQRKWIDKNARPRVWHYFNKKPWDMARGEWFDIEAWWTLATALLKDTRYTEEQRELLRSCFNASALATAPARGCSWCKAGGRKDWEGHPVFDTDGKIACPLLKPGVEEGAEEEEESKERERRRSRNRSRSRSRERTLRRSRKSRSRSPKDKGRRRERSRSRSRSRRRSRSRDEERARASRRSRSRSRSRSREGRKARNRGRSRSRSRSRSRRRDTGRDSGRRKRSRSRSASRKRRSRRSRSRSTGRRRSRSRDRRRGRRSRDRSGNRSRSRNRSAARRSSKDSRSPRRR